MIGHMHKTGAVLPAMLLAVIGLLPAAPAIRAAEKESRKAEKPQRESDKKNKSSKNQKEDASKSGGDGHETLEEIEASVAARAVNVPAAMNLDVEWQTPHVKPVFGRIVKGWVKEDLILLETDKHSLIAVRRADGVERWRCELSEAIRYEPAVSRNNVIVNLNNRLVAIEKNIGEIRWKLPPNFVMSCSPLVVDPPAYPREYSREWAELEHIYVGGWDGRFYNLRVRARMGKLAGTGGFSAPEFELSYPWHKTHQGCGIISANILLRDNLLYYTASDSNCHAVSREGEMREPYTLLGAPTSDLTITSGGSNNFNSVLSSVYIAALDNNLYCLDRLTLRKKWAYPAGQAGTGSIMADDQSTPFVYFATTDGKTRALKLTPAVLPSQHSTNEAPESCEQAWELPGAGAICAGPNIVYIGARRHTDHPGYSGVAAVNKNTGQTIWKEEGGEKAFFTSFLEFHNNWSADGARLFALTSDNRLVSLKEKPQDTALQSEKKAAPVDTVPAPPKPKKPKGDADKAE
jgi:outer membrane protein assembly factor BamB